MHGIKVKLSWDSADEITIAVLKGWRKDVWHTVKKGSKKDKLFWDAHTPELLAAIDLVLDYCSVPNEK